MKHNVTTFTITSNTQRQCNDGVRASASANDIFGAAIHVQSNVISEAYNSIEHNRNDR